jgi:hypothetical protein
MSFYSWFSFEIHPAKESLQYGISISKSFLILALFNTEK